MDDMPSIFRLHYVAAIHHLLRDIVILSLASCLRWSYIVSSVLLT